MAKRGLSPIISVILLIAIVLVLTASAFYFIQGLSQRSKSQAGSSEELLRTRMASCMELRTFNFNSTTNITQFTLYNCGSRNLALEDAIGYAKVVDDGQCYFTLNDSNCNGCNQTLGPNSFLLLSVNATNTTCGTGQSFADFLHSATGFSTNIELLTSDSTAQTALTVIL